MRKCVNYKDRIRFHVNDEKAFTPYWQGVEDDYKGSVPDSWHKCDLEEVEFDKNEHQHMIDEYNTIFSICFSVCVLEGHKWGDTTFNFNGKDSKACKHCNRIEAVQEVEK